VDMALTGQGALEFVTDNTYELVILDLGLPEVDGIHLLKHFRNLGGNAAVLVLTGRLKIVERELGLDAGADDYLTKPFDVRELLARVRALLRRPKQYRSTVLTAGELSLDCKHHRVHCNQHEIALKPLEFALLEFFLRHPNQVLTGESLLNGVWGSQSDASLDTLRTYIKTLRKKIDRPGVPSRISTLHGVGYRFDGGADER